MKQNGIFKGRVQICYAYGRYGYTRGGGKVWHGGADVVAVDDPEKIIYMPSYKGKPIVGEVVQARIVLSKLNRTWEWGYYVCVKLLKAQTPDRVNYLYFAHCDKLLVKKGQTVKTGDALAVMGNTGNAALNNPPYKHCHFEVRATSGGAGLDPTAYLGIENKVGIYGEKEDTAPATNAKDWTQAQEHDRSARYGKRYKVDVAALHIRKGAGTDQTIIKTLAKGTSVTWYGLYTVRDGKKWLYVAAPGGTTGFVAAEYLRA